MGLAVEQGGALQIGIVWRGLGRVDAFGRAQARQVAPGLQDAYTLLLQGAH